MGWPSLDDVVGPFAVEATVALPGAGNLPMEPESAPLNAVFFAPPPEAVPQQLTATFEHRRYEIRFRKVDVPAIRKGAIVRAPEVVAGGPVKQWFVDEVSIVGDEVRTLVKEL
jgi:hypothetical protein